MSGNTSLPADPERWGTIFMGPTSDRETTIDRVAFKQEMVRWNRRTEAEYMERVQARAKLRAQTIIDNARTNSSVIRKAALQWAEALRARTEARHNEVLTQQADAQRVLEEAENLRTSAYEEGYAAGQAQAQQELEAHLAELDFVTASVLQALAGQCAGITQSWRAELTELVLESVRTGTGWVLRQDRTAVLESLFDEAARALERRQRFRIRVNPEDVGTVDDVVRRAKVQFPDIEMWDVEADATLDPGGLIVESASGRVENTQESRRTLVDEVLRHLTLPEGPADEAARAGVTETVQAVALDDLAARANATLERIDREEQEAEAARAAQAAQEAAEKAAMENAQHPAAAEHAGASASGGGPQGVDPDIYFEQPDPQHDLGSPVPDNVVDADELTDLAFDASVLDGGQETDFSNVSATQADPTLAVDDGMDEGSGVGVEDALALLPSPEGFPDPVLDPVMNLTGAAETDLIPDAHAEQAQDFASDLPDGFAGDPAAFPVGHEGDAEQAFAAEAAHLASVYGDPAAGDDAAFVAFDPGFEPDPDDAIPVLQVTIPEADSASESMPDPDVTKGNTD